MTSLTHSRPSFFELCPKDRVLVGDMHYIVERQARGGMGCVYLLWLAPETPGGKIGALGLKLALKAILPESADADGRSLFKRELTVWAGFRHRNQERGRAPA